LYTSNHLFDATERIRGGCIARPITIGDGCWLAANVTVLPGVTIGANTIIGGGSVVTHDIPANVIAAGNPCQVIRPITATDRTGYTGTQFELS
ncbi:sugar O-acetyltransferase, partial [Lactiplantibacillus plantarum]|nr:sugar O-acetyltransferase [Lactiplantibacillus plantarum]